MEAFRISKEKFASTLNCSGKENRWNKDGEQILYIGSSRALATLELIVHYNFVMPSDDFKVMVISLPDDDALYEQILLKDLPKDWRSKSSYNELQKIGSDWYNSKRTLILKVPSAVIPKEYNFLINTTHPNFKKLIKLTRVEEYFWDERLFI